MAVVPTPDDPASDTVMSVVGVVSRFMQYCNGSFDSDSVRVPPMSLPAPSVKVIAVNVITFLSNMFSQLAEHYYFLVF